MRLIYFSPVFWKSFRQRPHFMIRHFLDRGGEQVLWVDPYPNRLPRLSDLRRGLGRGPGRGRRLHDQQTEEHPAVTVVTARALPIEPLPGGTWLNRHLLWSELLEQLLGFGADADCRIGVGRPSRLALSVLEQYPRSHRFFDAMDDFPEFYQGLSRRSMARVEARVASVVDHIWTSSTMLTEKFERAGFAGKLTPVFNAFDAGRVGPMPARRPDPPVFGYVGTISDWFDWDMVLGLARAVPDCRVRLIGPVFTALPAAMPDNIELLPPCAQEQVDAHLDGFSVGLIPFRTNSLTRGVDPLKYYEYRAKGLPVLSSRFGEMARRDGQPGVFLADGADGADMAARVEALLAYRADAAEVQAFRLANDWTARFRAGGLFEA